MSLLSQTRPDGAGTGGVSFPTQTTPELAAAAAAAHPRGGLDSNPRSPGRDPDPRSIRRPLGPSVWRYHARAANSLGRGALLPNKGPALIPQPSSGSQQADYPPFLKHPRLHGILLHRQHGRPLKVCAARGCRWQRNTGKKGRGRGVPLFVKGFFFSLLNKMSTPLYRCQLHYRTAPVAASTWNYLLIKQLPRRGSRGAGYLPGVPIWLRKFLFIPAGTSTVFIIPVSSSPLSAPK